MDKDISLRKYPYPFKAAFCFSNDIDLTTVERYLFLKDLFRNFPPSSPSTEPGLPYSESFFVFNHNPFHPEQISLKSHPDLMIPDIESGYLSTLHSWGDYNFNPLFSREHAKQGFEMLSGCRVKPRVWVNHGTTHNFQNIGAGIGYGDAKEYVDGAGTSYPLSTYHLDYIRKLGIEFYWISNPSRVIGQNVKLNAGRYWEAYYADSEESGDLKSTMLRLAKRYLYLPLKVKGVSNRLLQTRTMRDGSKVFEFLRYGNFAKATADDLPEVIPAEIIERLIESEGAMVFFTHLGKTKTSPDRLPEASMEVLRHLKKRFDEGILWICPLDHLLEHEVLTDSIRFEVRENEINIDSFRNEVKGCYSPVPEALAGLTFYCREPEKISVGYRSRQLKLKVNSADHTGRPSVTLQGFSDDLD